MGNKFRISTTPLSKNCQTIYFDFKEVLHDEGLDPQITDDCFCLYLCHFKILCVYLFRSQANGNCLFSTFSIAMCRDNRYVNDLRILTTIELYLDSEFYRNYLSFIWLISKQSKVFSGADTILAIPVLHNAFDSNKTMGELFQNEAINICTSFKWAGFLCVLGLASVCSCSIQCYYKNTGSVLKYKLM